MKTSIHLKQRTARSGFTLMEMILVLAIIALLVGLGIFSTANIGLQAERQKAEADIQTMKMNLQRYKTMCKQFPSQSQGLDSLVSSPSPRPNGWMQFVDSKEALLDPWGNLYQYRNPGKTNRNSPDVFSSGPDGQVGSEDDVE
jgi:general secretion pathway protein G